MLPFFGKKNLKRKHIEGLINIQNNQTMSKRKLDEPYVYVLYYQNQLTIESNIPIMTDFKSLYEVVDTLYYMKERPKNVLVTDIFTNTGMPTLYIGEEMKLEGDAVQFIKMNKEYYEKKLKEYIGEEKEYKKYISPTRLHKKYHADCLECARAIVKETYFLINPPKTVPKIGPCSRITEPQDETWHLSIQKVVRVFEDFIFPFFEIINEILRKNMVARELLNRYMCCYDFVIEQMKKEVNDTLKRFQWYKDFIEMLDDVKLRMEGYVEWMNRDIWIEGSRFASNYLIIP